MCDPDNEQTHSNSPKHNLIIRIRIRYDCLCPEKSRYCHQPFQFIKKRWVCDFVLWPGTSARKCVILLLLSRVIKCRRRLCYLIKVMFTNASICRQVNKIKQCDCSPPRLLKTRVYLPALSCNLHSNNRHLTTADWLIRLCQLVLRAQKGSEPTESILLAFTMILLLVEVGCTKILLWTNQMVCLEKTPYTLDAGATELWTIVPTKPPQMTIKRWLQRDTDWTWSDRDYRDAKWIERPLRATAEPQKQPQEKQITTAMTNIQKWMTKKCETTK